MARAQFANLFEPLDFKRTTMRSFVFDGLVQCAAKRILAQHADDNRRVGRREAVARPFDKLSKVV